MYFQHRKEAGPAELALCFSSTVLIAVAQNNSEPSLKPCAFGGMICNNTNSGSVTQTHTMHLSMLSLVFLIKVEDATFLS